MHTKTAISILIVNLLLLPGLAIAQSTKNAAATQDKTDATQDKTDAKQKFSVADGYLTFQATSNWKKLQPKIDFIHAEFSIPKAAGDANDARITFSQVGGSIEDNLDRWVNQFQDVDATDSEQVSKTTKTIDGKQVELIMINGTFLDSGGGPLGPKTERENYTLMGAAIEAEGGNNVYIKAYGPKKTMEANHKALEEMVMSMKSTDG